MATPAKPLTPPAAKRPAPPKAKLLRPDAATLGGLILAFGGILGGLILEGGRLKDVSQITAALIVLGGTCGAVLVSTPIGLLGAAVRRLGHVIVDQSQSAESVIDELIAYATSARRNGLVSLETDAMQIENPFLRKALMLAVDGTDLQEIRNMMQLEIELAERQGFAAARVFECAGGYSPTIGIIGAVLGLIQVMKNLANIEEVGHGIAVAFVATVYGVGIANVVLLPVATKIKARIDNETALKEMMLEGVVAIVEGLNPKIIRNKLEAYQHESKRKSMYATATSAFATPAAPRGAARR
ncbi:MAG TPA: flagellar motor protein [Bryobacteraceae bacterium]|nr:flagellar motor protein [Bryobacteraceae bacterium]